VTAGATKGSFKLPGSDTSVTLGGALFADLLAREPDIDAVFCANDDLALGVLFECRRREIAVPEQIAIVGFNDLEFMASSVPTLTSVRTNRYEMGSAAAAMLIEAIEGKRPEVPVLDLGFTVIERQSSQTQRPAAGPRTPEWAPAVQNDSVTNEP